MIILLRKKSVKWLAILLLAAVIFGGVMRWESQPSEEENKPTIAVMATRKLPPIEAKETPTKQLTVENLPQDVADDALATENLPLEIETNGQAADTLPAETEDDGAPAENLSDDPAVADDNLALAETLDDEETIIALRMERNQNRAQQQAQLEDILANEAVSGPTKAQAEEKLLQLGETTAMELETETLLKTKGYTKSVVMIDSGRANVYMAEHLSAEDYDKIGDLVQSSTKFSLEQIIIIPK